jgi:hypothetical protein
VISAARRRRPLLIEFGYELDPADKLREATRFYLDPQTFFSRTPRTTSTTP